MRRLTDKNIALFTVGLLVSAYLLMIRQLPGRRTRRKPVNDQKQGIGGVINPSDRMPDCDCSAVSRACRVRLFAPAALLVWMAAPLAAQTAPRLWAAQTGPDEVSLTWDSVPGTHEYLIYAAPADSVVNNLRMLPTLRRLSASSRGSTLYGIRQLTRGITLVAMAADGHVIQKAEFNRITPATSFVSIRPPEGVTAEITGSAQITLTWTPVPGATAYRIGRVVFPGGLRIVCTVCSSDPRYVDNEVLAGAATSYTVAAIFPQGKSQPAPSNKVTPGVTEVAAVPPPGQSMTRIPPGTLTSPATSPSGTLTGTLPGSTTTPTTSTSAATDSAQPLLNSQPPATVTPTARQLAQSAEQDKRSGYRAAAPIANSDKPITVTVNPDNSTSRQAEFQSKGNLSPAGAAFLAATKLGITRINKGLFQFTATFPTNTTANMTIRLIPNQKYTLTSAESASGRQPYGIHLTNGMTGKNEIISLQYFLANRVRPAVLAARPYGFMDSEGGRSGRIQLVAYKPGYIAHKTELLAEAGGEESGIIVQFISEIEEKGVDFIGKVEELFMEQEGMEGAPIKTTYTSAVEVFEALNRGNEYQEMVSQLDELEVRAQYPTNPLTKKAYAEDPGVKQQILDEIADARAELKIDTALQYMNQEISLAMELSGQEEISAVIKPVTKWNDKAAKQLMEERISIIKKMIATGTVNTQPPTTVNIPDIPIPPENTPAQKALEEGQWTGTYGGMHHTSIPGSATIDIADSGKFIITIKNGEITGTGTGHVVFHSQDPNGGTGDGQTDYRFPISGTVIGGKIQLTMDGMPDPPTMTIVGIAKDGHREKSLAPVTAPLMARDSIDLKHGGTATIIDNTGQSGMQINFTGKTSID